MPNPSHYQGREQTYVKHLFLERYLDRLANKILRTKLRTVPKLIYVDGFSGPWESESGEGSDTSYSLALRKLTQVIGQIEDQNGKAEAEAIFVERDARSVAKLKEHVGQFTRIPSTIHNCDFETAIPHIAERIKDQFALVFVDPTGWTGLSMQALGPLLRASRGEVLINFMYYAINRFTNTNDPAVRSSLDALFGSDTWREEFEQLTHEFGDREHALVVTYCRRIRAAGRYQFVTATPIYVPGENRPYFYLVYATRHEDGVIVFRNAEAASLKEQNLIGMEIRERKNQMADLFASATDAGMDRFRYRQAASLSRVRAGMIEWINGGTRRTRGWLTAELMCEPYTERRIVTKIIREAEKRGAIMCVRPAEGDATRDILEGVPSVSKNEMR